MLTQVWFCNIVSQEGFNGTKLDNFFYRAQPKNCMTENYVSSAVCTALIITLF